MISAAMDSTSSGEASAITPPPPPSSSGWGGAAGGAVWLAGGLAATFLLGLAAGRSLRCLPGEEVTGSSAREVRDEEGERSGGEGSGVAGAVGGGDLAVPGGMGGGCRVWEGTDQVGGG